MKKSRFKSNLSVILFISAGVAVLLVGGVYYAYRQAMLVVRLREIYLAQEIPKAAGDKYSFNENYKENIDPYITKTPRLEDVLAGPIISARDPSLGSKAATVTVVIFSDFVCSYCHEQEQILKKILEKYNGDVRLIWKDYPEIDINSASWQGALAARCAQEQGQFWLYHDEVFSMPGNFSNLDLLNIADTIGLNRKEYIACLDSVAPVGIIKDNIEEANVLGIKGIPFIYVNDKEILGEISFEEFEKIIETELEKDDNK